MFFPMFVCLSVCLLARLLKNAWTNWLTFEPDPNYSSDARAGLISPISRISAAMQNFMSGKSDVYVLVACRCSEAWFYNGFIH